MYRSLNESGVVILNLGSALNGPGSEFLDAELATYKAVFPNVSVFKVNREYDDRRLQNLIIVAGRSEAAPSLSSPDAEISALLANRYEREVRQALPVLTDDLAPVEYYNSTAQNIYLRENAK